jgi:hypothetical protein
MPSQIKECLFVEVESYEEAMQYPSVILPENAEFCSYAIQSSDGEPVVVFKNACGQYLPTSSDLAVFDEQSLATRVANLEREGQDASISREALTRLRAVIVR